MANLTLTILPAKALRGGRHKVRVAVAHNSQTRYILTDVIIDTASQFKNGKVCKRDDAAYLNTKLRKKLDEVQHSIDSIDYIEGLTCSELIETINSKDKKQRLTLREVFDEIVNTSTAKDSTLKNYKYLFSTLTRYIPENTKVANLRPAQVERVHIRALKDMKPVSASGPIMLLKTIVNHSQRNGYTEFTRLPTANLHCTQFAVRENWLSPDEVRRIRDLNHKKKSVTKFQKLFMLSYYLGGINYMDLVSINFNEQKKVLKYIRRKTDRKSKVNVYVEFTMPGEALELIGQLKNDDGYIRPWHDYSRIPQKCGNAMKEASGNPNITFYSARKSFAQHAFNLGVSESVIDYILGHSLGHASTSLYSYIKVTPQMATDAIRKVCDFLATTENFD